MLITVKAARVNAGMTKDKAAEALGLSLTGYIRKENGKSRFYADELAAASRLFNVSLLNFFEAGCSEKTLNAD